MPVYIYEVITHSWQVVTEVYSATRLNVEVHNVITKAVHSQSLRVAYMCYTQRPYHLSKLQRYMYMCVCTPSYSQSAKEE